MTRVMAEYAVDQSCLSMVGLSMGGFINWHLAVTFPDRFATLTLICGSEPWFSGFPELVGVIKHVHLWVFYREKDR